MTISSRNPFNSSLEGQQELYSMWNYMGTLSTEANVATQAFQESYENFKGRGLLNPLDSDGSALEALKSSPKKEGIKDLKEGIRDFIARFVGLSSNEVNPLVKKVDEQFIVFRKNILEHVGAISEKEKILKAMEETIEGIAIAKEFEKSVLPQFSSREATSHFVGKSARESFPYLREESRRGSYRGDVEYDDESERVDSSFKEIAIDPLEALVSKFRNTQHEISSSKHAYLKFIKDDVDVVKAKLSREEISLKDARQIFFVYQKVLASCRPVASPSGVDFIDRINIDSLNEAINKRSRNAGDAVKSLREVIHEEEEARLLGSAEKTIQFTSMAIGIAGGVGLTYYFLRPSTP